MEAFKYVAQRAFWLITVVFAVVAAEMGYPQMIIHLLLGKLLFAVVVSMKIQAWQKRDDLLVESGKESWIGNVHGFPVKDTTSVLKNLHLDAERKLRSTFVWLLLPKAALAGVLLVHFIRAVTPLASQWPFLVTDVDAAVAATVFAYLLVQLVASLRLLLTAHAGDWEVNRYPFGNKTFYSAYVKKRNGECSPFLMEIF